MINSNIKSSLIILSTITLSIGLAPIAYTQPVLALPIGSIDLDELYHLPELNGLQGPQGEKGDTGEQGFQGEKGDTGEQGPAGQGVEYGHLIVFKHVRNFWTINVQASDLTIHVIGNHQTPDTFQGSESGTKVTLKFGNYEVTEEKSTNPNLQGNHLRTEYSQDCSGVIHPDETKTCVITNTITP